MEYRGLARNQEVKFAGGLLGHLDKGGTFDVKQTEIAPGVWDVTYMNIQMNGKALFFKTIAVREKDIRSDYRRVSSQLTLAQAADLLNRQTNMASFNALAELVAPQATPQKLCKTLWKTGAGPRAWRQTETAQQIARLTITEIRRCICTNKRR